MQIYSGSDSTGSHFSGKDLGFFNQETGMAVGSYETDNLSGAGILATLDAGDNWDLVWKYPDELNAGYSLNAIHAANANAWAVGERGLVINSVELDSFRIIDVNTDLPLNDVFFTDEIHGWIAGGYINAPDDYRFIFIKTKDGGDTWVEIQNFNYRINDMFFEDSLHGLAVGCDSKENGVILETFDGGDNWSVLIDGLSAPLNAIHFKDGYGWAVGYNGFVLRTDNGLSRIDKPAGEFYPSKFRLYQNYPNPFNPSTTIEFTLPEPEHVKLKIYTILGKKVAELSLKNQPPGVYQYQFDGSSLASGIYYYQLVAGDYREVKKMILLR